MDREELAEKIHWKAVIKFLGVVNGVFMLPQALSLFITREHEGISLITLFILIVIQIGFALHGFFLYDKTLIWSNTVAGTLSATVFILTFYFRYL